MLEHMIRDGDILFQLKSRTFHKHLLYRKHFDRASALTADAKLWSTHMSVHFELLCARPIKILAQSESLSLHSEIFIDDKLLSTARFSAIKLPPSQKLQSINLTHVSDSMRRKQLDPKNPNPSFPNEQEMMKSS
jgi:hypothetical protein